MHAATAPCSSARDLGANNSATVEGEMVTFGKLGRSAVEWYDSDEDSGVALNKCIHHNDINQQP